MVQALAYRRVLLKLSGEALGHWRWEHHPRDRCECLWHRASHSRLYGHVGHRHQWSLAPVSP